MSKFLKLSLIQIKGYSMGERDKSREEILNSLEEAIKSNPDIILFPECAFPSYSLKGWDEDINEECLKLLGELKAKALAQKCYIVIGMPETVFQEDGNKVLYNSAYVINSGGEIEITGRKQFLWHFDSLWFKAAKHSSAFDTKWGRIGLMICADGRAPEIIGSLGLLECDLVLNCTNWVSSGSDETMLSNPQADFLMSVRAIEQKFWMAAANKVGMEDDFIVFCGKSMLVAPDGRIMSIASSNRAEILECSIPLNEETGKIDRSSERSITSNIKNSYSLLNINGNNIERKNHIYLGAANLKVKGDFRKAFYDFFQKADLLGLDFLIAAVEAEEDLKEIRKFLKEIEIYRKLVFLNLRNALEDLNIIFYEGQQVIAEGTSLVELGTLKLGLTCNNDGLSPYIYRNMMVDGADILIWMHDGKIDFHKKIARARAMENRTFAVSLCRNENYSSLICGPDGNVISESFIGKNQIIAAYADLVLGERKTVVPGTDVKENSITYR